MKKQTSTRDNIGFTLVEILIVVVILGILAAIIIPSFGKASSQSSQTAFANSIKTFARAAYYYESKTGEFPRDGSSGQVPAGFEDYINTDLWTKGTPIGGVWDTERNNPFGASLGVHFFPDASENPGDAYMTEVDALIDDGDLTTGGFQKTEATRYYMVLDP